MKQVGNGCAGSTLEDFLGSEGVLDESAAIAIKRVIAWELEQARRVKHIGKADMARRMKTSRSQVDRLFDPTNASVQLDTVAKAASVLGRRLTFALEVV